MGVFGSTMAGYRNCPRNEGQGRAFVGTKRVHHGSRQGGSHCVDELGGDRAETKPSPAGHQCAFSCRKDKPKFSSNIEARLKIPSVAMQWKERDRA